MFRYALRRLLTAIPVLWIALTACFFTLRLAPGGPFDGERALPEKIKENLLAYYDMDKSIFEQYFLYLSRVLSGDLGPSFVTKDFTVTEMLADGLPYTLILGGTAFIVSVFFGVLTGILAAKYQNKSIDYLLVIVVMTGLVVPNFLIAPIFQLIFGIYLDWFPVGGWGGPMHLFLPVVILSLAHIARISRLMRGSMIETLNANYVRTARAKGIGERRVITRHALRTALAPVVSYCGPAASFLLTGSIVIEQIFGLPGIGRHFVTAALNRDYGVVLGTVIFYMVLITVLNLIVDMIYAWLDPKVRYQ